MKVHLAAFHLTGTHLTPLPELHFRRRSMAFTFNDWLGLLGGSTQPSPSSEATMYENAPGKLPARCVCNKDTSTPHTCKIYGHYRCACGKWWRSGNSWYEWHNQRLLTQECQRCGTAVKPQQFHKLKISATADDAERGPHDVSRCERCKSLGTDCSKLAARGASRGRGSRRPYRRY